MGMLDLVRSPSFVSHPSATLLTLSQKDRFTASQAWEHVVAFGATGSGKTSGGGAALARAYLRAGWGGLVCCPKPEDAAMWERYARETGRSRNVIRVDGSGRHRFNFLQYLMETSPDPGGLVINAVATIATVIAAANGNTGQGGSENQFWQKSMKEALTHSIAVLWAAYGRINLYDLFALIHSRPMTYQQATEAQWHEASFMARTLRLADESPAHPMHPMDYRSAFTYLTRTLANPDSRTTGNLLATISADLAPLMQGKMRELFCTGTTVVPEMTHEGAIIILDLPIRVWGDAGLLAQHVFKYLWQKAAEARCVDRRTRPVFLWCDEAQFFVSPYDAEFLSTARSAKAATVYLTQNLPGLYNRIGGARPEHAVDALLGNFQTKIAHANGCSKTNQWFSDTIGRGLQLRWSGSENEGWNTGTSINYNNSTTTTKTGTSQTGGGGFSRSRGGSGGSSISYSEQMDYQVQPAAFTRLRKGGRDNGRLVDGIMFQGGRVFRHSGRTFLPVVFKQG